MQVSGAIPVTVTWRAALPGGLEPESAAGPDRESAPDFITLVKRPALVGIFGQGFDPPHLHHDSPVVHYTGMSRLRRKWTIDVDEPDGVATVAQADPSR